MKLKTSSLKTNCATTKRTRRTRHARRPGRNDVGRVSEFGFRQSRDLMFVERYSHVMHLVSAVEGTLRAGLTPIDALSFLLPCRHSHWRAKSPRLEIIEEVEPVRRGIYGGSVLYADFAGNLDSCIAIRTMLVKARKLMSRPARDRGRFSP